MTTNPKALEVASTALKLMDTSVMENIVKSGKLLLSKLEELQKSYPDLILRVQGTGLIISCEINSKVKVVAEKGLEYRLRCHGLGIIHGGTNCLRLTPHFMLSEDEINLIIKVLDKVLLQYYSS